MANPLPPHLAPGSGPNYPATTHTGTIAWFARNPVAANLLMVILLFAGAYSLMEIRTEAFPALDSDTVNISVPFLGGSPSEVEEGVTVKIEEALDGLEGIKHVKSWVYSTYTRLEIEAEDDYDIEQLQDDIKLRVDAITSFPALAEKPTISLKDPDGRVASIVVFGDTDQATLRKVALNLRDELLSLPSINKVSDDGIQDFEINIEVSEENLRRYNLTLAQVAEAVRANSVNLTGGDIKTQHGKINLRSNEQAYFGKDFEQLIVRTTADGGVLRLGDIATVNDGFIEQDELNRFQGKPAIELNVGLLGDASVMTASRDAKIKAQELRDAGVIPRNVEIVQWFDEAVNITQRLDLLSRNAMTGILLVLIMLSLFLNWRVAMWVAVGIPISFAGALMLVGPGILNYSLNFLTTFGFLVVLGIVVDDAIVIGENIYSAKERAHAAGDNGDEAELIETTIRGAQEVAVPATFGVLTTVAAFFPLTLISTRMGEILSTIAVVVICCLIFSLVESKWILPAHLAHVKVGVDNETNRFAKRWSAFQQRIEQRLMRFIEHHYRPLVSKAIRFRYATTFSFIAVLILVLSFIPAGLVRVSFFPPVEFGIVIATATVQKGMGVERTHDMGLLMEEALVPVNQAIVDKYQLDHDAIRYVYTYSNTDDSVTLWVDAQVDDRVFSAQEVINLWRKEVGQVEGVKNIDFRSIGPGADVDIRIELSSSDYDQLAPAAEALKAKLQTYQGIHDLNTTFDEGDLELQVTLKPEARALGLTQNDVASQLRNTLYGFEAQRIQRGREEIKVRVRYPKSERDQLSDLENIRIRTPDGGTVPLFVVASLNKVQSLTDIRRVDKKRVIIITGRTDKQVTEPTTVINDLTNNGFFKQLQQDYPGLGISQAGEFEQQSKATASLIQGFALALALIYILLAIPLKSYTEPLIIMSAIPFGIIGAVAGHMFMGITLSLMSFFGILALSGVVVNDSLVMTSRYNRMRADGVDYETALIESSISRFRAILLTSVTTFIGLAPLLLERSVQAQFLIPMATSLSFGIIFATLITLVLIPSCLGIQHDLHLKIKSWFSASSEAKSSTNDRAPL